MTTQDEVQAVVMNFVTAMHRWELQAAQASQVLHATSAAPEALEEQQLALERIEEIFAMYCADKVRNEVNPRYRHHQSPPEYDPGSERVVASILVGTYEAQVVTERRGPAHAGRYRYAMLRQKGGWRIAKLEVWAEDRWEVQAL